MSKKEEKQKTSSPDLQKPEALWARFARFVEESGKTKSEAYGEPPLARFVVSLGLLSEVGEILDQVKAVYEQGRPYNRDALLEEVGDLMWYVARYHEAHRLSADDTYQGIHDLLFLANPEESVDALCASADLLRRTCQLIYPPDEIRRSLRRLTAAAISVVRELDVLHGGQALPDALEDRLVWTEKTFVDVLDRNGAKLAKRYGDSFSTQKSIDR